MQKDPQPLPTSHTHTHTRTPSSDRQINPAVKSVQELKITDNCCPAGMPIHHRKYH